MSEPSPTPEMIGHALIREDHAEAARFLGAWVKRYPRDGEAWFNLGYCQRQLLKPEAALIAYRRALHVGITEPEQVHLNMAAIKAEVLHDVPGARYSLTAALAEQPGFTLAWQNLGQLEEDVGDPVAARAAYEQALNLQPSNGRALARLAGIDAFEGNPMAGLERIRQAAPLALGVEDRIELAFAEANLLDGLGRFDEAFVAAKEANLLQQRTAPVRYSEAAVEAQIDAIINLFPVEVSKPTDAEMAPIFICGLFRSGSTLLETLLNRQVGVTMGGELAFTPWFMQHHRNHVTPTTLPDLVTRFRAEYADFAVSVLGSIAVFTDKRMDNFLHLGLIKRAFPAAKIIHVLRDPMDNFMSMYFQPFTYNLTYANDFGDMLHYYRHYRRLMAHWQACYAEDIIPVRYEALVAEPKAVVATLARQMGLAGTPINVPDQIIRTASVWQVRQPIHTKSRGRWRNYSTHVGSIAARLSAEYSEFTV